MCVCVCVMLVRLKMEAKREYKSKYVHVQVYVQRNGRGSGCETSTGMYIHKSIYILYMKFVCVQRPKWWYKKRGTWARPYSRFHSQAPGHRPRLMGNPYSRFNHRIYTSLISSIQHLHLAQNSKVFK